MVYTSVNGLVYPRKRQSLASAFTVNRGQAGFRKPKLKNG